MDGVYQEVGSDGGGCSGNGGATRVSSYDIQHYLHVRCQWCDLPGSHVLQSHTSQLSAQWLCLCPIERLFVFREPIREYGSWRRRATDRLGRAIFLVLGYRQGKSNGPPTLFRRP